MAQSGLFGPFVSLLFVLSCWTRISAGATLSLEEKLQQLETTLQATVNQLQEKVVQLEEKVAQVQATNVQLEVQIQQNVPNRIFIFRTSSSVGKAMNLTTGKFTVPRSGTYFFSFTALASFPPSVPEVFCLAYLYWNGVKTGSGGVEEANTAYLQSSPFSVHSTLKLKSGDEIWIQINEMSDETILYNDAGDLLTQFTGWMLDEEIVASL
ncbi:complement C1q tumor necrosis factor-related protein 3-like [Daphnia pulex]|uniref:complement C1q tumor necrosis factor-related protein 3-like n=1 Tax=Daphnia pulex TaxID=6669 RepID=UPI001EDE593A|nr:complement C1q tumor necrosis factor-related protein 3-like [Daphnia pulex]